MRNSHFVAIKDKDNKARLIPLKEYARRKGFPMGTTHQLRNWLRKKGYLYLERPGEIILIEPFVPTEKAERKLGILKNKGKCIIKSDFDISDEELIS
ncbi:MAG: hypothetical protein LWW95_07975 [Candidatus Desulfofervidus auxilii]|nr:hypothetical protein [Candidatus Desulfofervidus auxilii]